MGRAWISFWSDEKSTDQFLDGSEELRSVLDRSEEHGSVFGLMRRARIRFLTDEKSTDKFLER